MVPAENLNKRSKHTILGGDFNCVLDESLDLLRDATSPYDNHGHDQLKQMTETRHLEDIRPIAFEFHSR